MVDFLSQPGELLWIVDKVKEERGEDRSRGIGPSDDDEVTISHHNLGWYFLFFCTQFVRL